MKSAIDSKIKNRQLNNLLNGIIDRTSGDLGRVRDELARWFDNGMDRVSGAYKRKTQAWSFVIALITIAILNVSAIDVGRALWQQPIISRTIAANPNQTLAQALKQLDELGNTGIPIGWTEANRVTFRSTRGIWTVVGWVVTAIATLFGAPFWFDLLKKFVNLRQTGLPPDEIAKAKNLGLAVVFMIAAAFGQVITEDQAGELINMAKAQPVTAEFTALQRVVRMPKVKMRKQKAKKSQKPASRARRSRRPVVLHPAIAATSPRAQHAAHHFLAAGKVPNGR